MKQQKGNTLLALVIWLAIFFTPIAGWLTHIYFCIKLASWGFLIAGAIFFPIGILHGWGIWFGIFP